MKIIHTIFVAVTLLSICIHTMERPSVAAVLSLLHPDDTNNTLVKICQPKSLKSLAATVIAHSISPTKSVMSAMHAFNSTLLNQPEIANAIGHSLAQQEQEALRNILKSQNPLLLQINRFTVFPHNLYPLTAHGLYVRSKVDGYDPEAPDPLYAGIAQLIPDPLAQNAPIQFFQVYSNPNGKTYFDDDETETGRDETSRGICIWDKKTGVCINDGKVVRAKLCVKYPQIINLNPGLRDFFLYGMSANDLNAWCRFVYNTPGEIKNGLCVFRIQDNEILDISLSCDGIGPLSPSGTLCPVYMPTNPNNLIKHTDCISEPIQLPHGRPQAATELFRYIRAISPCDNHALLSCIRSPHLPACTQVVNLQTKDTHVLTIDNQHIQLGNGTRTPLNHDGTLLAIEKNNKINILQILTNTVLWSLPIYPNLKDGEFRLLFSPDSTQLLAYNTNNDDDNTDSLVVFDIASHKPIEKLDEQHIQQKTLCDIEDFIFCNEGDYLLLPNGQLCIQPQGLVSHLSFKELIGLLILEHQKITHLPFTQEIQSCLHNNQFPQLQRLFKIRYTAMSSHK